MFSYANTRPDVYAELRFSLIVSMLAPLQCLNTAARRHIGPSLFMFEPHTCHAAGQFDFDHHLLSMQIQIQLMSHIFFFFFRAANATSGS